MTDSIAFSGFDDFADKLDEVATRARLTGIKALIESGAEIVLVAKQLAEEHSSSIPPTIRLIPGDDHIVIVAGGANAPLARLYEMGNVNGSQHAMGHTRFRKTGLAGPVTQLQYQHGQRTRSGFSHPVFGNMDVWATQEGYPFMRPALRTRRRAITKNNMATYADAFRDVFDD